MLEDVVTVGKLLDETVWETLCDPVVVAETLAVAD